MNFLLKINHVLTLPQIRKTQQQTTRSRGAPRKGSSTSCEVKSENANGDEGCAGREEGFGVEPETRLVCFYPISAIVTILVRDLG